jgi:uncharacterized cupin superfamily protein
MPRIDIDKVPIDTATGYPPPFNKAVDGRSRKRLARAAGLTQFCVNVCTLKPGAASSQLHLYEKEDELVYILKARSCCVKTMADRAKAWRCCCLESRCVRRILPDQSV